MGERSALTKVMLATVLGVGATQILGCASSQPAAGATKPASSDARRGVAVGAAAPDFRLTTTSGVEWRLATTRGRVVVVEFWSTTCVPCKRALLDLEALYRSRRDAGLEVVAVNVDPEEPTAAAFARLGVSFAVGFDERQRVSAVFDVESVPRTFVIDRRGVVRYVRGSYKTAETEGFERVITALLTESVAGR